MTKAAPNSSSQTVRVAASLPDTALLLAAETCPLIDPCGATFVYRGRADSVRWRSWVHGLPGSLPMQRLASGDAWALRIELPPGSRIEYKLEIGQDGRVEWILDPMNPVVATDPFGANSVCRGYGYVRPPWSLPDPAAKPGHVDEIVVESRALGTSRSIGLYVPARFERGTRYPLLVAHDGFDYLRYASLPVVLDNLIHRRDIPPLVAVLTQSDDRLREYGGDDRHAEFVANELPAAVEQRLDLQPTLGGRVLMGASFGAVASLHAAWRHPAAYRGLLLQSGSFARDESLHGWGATTVGSVADFVNRFHASPGRMADSVYVSCGSYESLLDDNRDLLPVLRQSASEVLYEEAPDGHHWENWRDRLQSALSWLFAGRPRRAQP